MEAEAVNTAILTPPPGEPAPPSTEPAVSVAEHAAQFDPKRTPEPEPEPTTPPAAPQADRPRHKAKSQQATAEDVPRINELTRRLREAERERDEWKAKHSAVPSPVPEQPTSAAIAEPKTATAGKPVWQTFEEQIGTKYQTWGEAQDAYVDARDEWKETQASQARAVQQQTSAQQAIIESYVTKARAYTATAPDYFDKMAAAAPVLDHIPPLLYHAIVAHDNAPEILYYLVQHPSDLDDMCLLADGKSVSESSVALLQRRLSHYRQPAADIGSVAPAVPRPIAPRPPNPVRTGPLKTGDDPPAEGHSLAEHEKAFGKRRR